MGVQREHLTCLSAQRAAAGPWDTQGAMSEVLGETYQFKKDSSRGPRTPRDSPLAWTTLPFLHQTLLSGAKQTVG